MNKTANNKRTTIPRIFEYDKQFYKDWKRLNNCGRYNMNKLKEVMLLLIANNKALPESYKDHELTNYNGVRECHIGGDFLLMYLIEDDVIVFIRAGTHSELFV
ncbi:type II toxin-antitoxin system YafQ family toxin [Orbaceae bacterium ac157xtp]